MSIVRAEEVQVCSLLHLGQILTITIKLWLAIAVAFTSLATLPVQAQISISIPGLSIGINLPQQPRLVQVPGYPVYYAPQLQSNYFFYEGMYWVFESNNWYSSVWYNGPWSAAIPQNGPDNAPVGINGIAD